MKEDTGQILIVDKIVNNNIVIAKDFRGREVVAIGKGVGFRKRKNEAVHRSEIMKTYVLLDKVDSGVLTLFEEIQFEVIETSQKIIDYAQEKLNVKFNVNLLMSLSDHINFALIQYRQGNHVPKLVNEEVKRFYKEEYHIGEIAVQMINERFSKRRSNGYSVSFDYGNREQVESSDDDYHEGCFGYCKNCRRLSECLFT